MSIVASELTPLNSLSPQSSNSISLANAEWYVHFFCRFLSSIIQSKENSNCQYFFCTLSKHFSNISYWSFIFSFFIFFGRILIRMNSEDLLITMANVQYNFFFYQFSFSLFICHKCFWIHRIFSTAYWKKRNEKKKIDEFMICDAVFFSFFHFLVLSLIFFSFFLLLLSLAWILTSCVFRCAAYVCASLSNYVWLSLSDNHTHTYTHTRAYTHMDGRDSLSPGLSLLCAVHFVSCFVHRLHRNNKIKSKNSKLAWWDPLQHNTMQHVYTCLLTHTHTQVLGKY